MKLAGIAVAVGMLIGAASAQAAYPGTNGKIVFASGDPASLFSMDPNGANPQPFDGAGIGPPSFSADGSKVAYVKPEEPDGIVVRNTNGTGTPVFFSAPPDFNPFSRDYESPSLSADGERVVFVLRDSFPGAGSNILVADVNGSGIPVYLTNDGVSFEPALSPDGSTTYYNKNDDIYKMASDGGPFPLSGSVDGAATAAAERDPELSPNGSTLLYEKFVGSDFDIHGVSLSGPPNETFVIPDAGDDEDPAYSPDGTKIAYSSDDDTPTDDLVDEIFVADADGSDKTNLTNSDAVTDSSPSWSAPFPPVPSPAPAPGPVSAATTLPGAVTPAVAPKKCKKGQKLKKGKCVRKKRKK